MSCRMPFFLQRWTSRGLPLLSGGLLVFAYPRWNQEWVVWVWLLPLLWVLWAAKEVKRPFWAGYLAGVAFFVPNLFWIRHSSRVIAGAVDENDNLLALVKQTGAVQVLRTAIAQRQSGSVVPAPAFLPDVAAPQERAA